MRADLLTRTLDALERGDSAAAWVLLRWAAAEEVMSAGVAGLDSVDLYTRLPRLLLAVPERAEHLEGPDPDRSWARRSVLWLLAHADPERALPLIGRALDEELGHTIEAPYPEFSYAEAAHILGLLAIVDPPEARRRAEPLQAAKDLPSRAVSAFAAACLTWDPEEAASVLEARLPAERVAAAADRALGDWLRLSAAPVPPDYPLPVLSLAGVPGDTIHSIVDRLLLEGRAIPFRSLLRLADRLGIEVTEQLGRYVAVAGCHFPADLVEFLAELPDPEVRSVAPQILAASWTRSGGSPIDRLSLDRRFPRAVPLGRLHVAAAGADWGACESLLGDLALDNYGRWLAVLCANAARFDHPDLARRAAARLAEPAAGYAQDERRWSLADVAGLCELAPEAVDEVAGGLGGDDPFLRRLGFHVEARGAVFERLLGSVGPANAGAYAGWIVHRTGTWDERAERLFERAWRTPDARVEAMAALVVADPHRAAVKAREASDPDIDAAVVGARLDLAEARAALEVLRQAVASGNVRAARGALVIAARHVVSRRLGEARLVELLDALGAAPDDVLAAVHADLGPLSPPWLCGEAGTRLRAEILRRAVAARPPAGVFRPLPPAAEVLPSARRIRRRPRLDPTLGDPDARRLRARLAVGDFREVARHLAEVRDVDDREFLVDALSAWEEVPAVFHDWVEAEPRSAEAHLLRGGVHLLQATDFQRRDVRMALAEAAVVDLRIAATLSPDDALPHALLLRAHLLLGTSLDEAGIDFAESLCRAPANRPALHGMVSLLAWAGRAVGPALALAREAAAAAPEGSSLHVLPVVAHVQWWRRLSWRRGKPAQDQADGYLQQEPVVEEIRTAFERSVFSAHHRETRRSIADRNWLAFAFWIAGEALLARVLLDAIDGQVTEEPWRFESEPEWVIQLALWAVSEA